MKRMKKLLAVLLAAVMMMTMGSMSVMAAGNKTITITGAESGKTYWAYQIFSGTYDSQTGALSSIGTGTGLNIDETSQSDIKAITNLLTSSTASVNITYGTTTYTELGSFVEAYMVDNANDSIAWIATLLTEYGDDNPNMVTAFAEITAQFLTSTYYTATESNGTYTFTVPDGYYLIVDKTATNTTENGVAASRYMLVMAGTEVKDKTVVPTLDKQIVLDGGNEDTTTASIGDTITYVLTSAVPDMTGYSKYTFNITDTISSGLTLKETASRINVSTAAIAEDLYELDLTVTVGGSTISGMRVNGSADADAAASYAYYYYTASGSNSTTILTIVFNDFINKNYTTNAAILVTYKAELNTSAVIGSTGNDNTAQLTYSNNPNLVSDGQSGYTPSTDTGTTVEEKAVVYTYELDLTKVDSVETTKGLSGAKFYLTKEVDGTTYYAVADEITTGTDGYYKVKGWTATEASKTTFVSGSAGELHITGLGAGIYELYESEAPTGYTAWASAMEVVIEATTSGTGTTSLSATIGGTAVDASNISTTAGTIAASITNSSSSILPTTGGIGTTIFYVIGAVLVIGASVILITRRRMATR